MTAAESRENGALVELLAQVLDYPAGAVARRAREAAAALAETSPEAAARLARFVEFAVSVPAGALEEAYTAAFDLQPVCSLYVGYQLFGDGEKRGLFLSRLCALYREHAFRWGTEMADHLVVMLRFLAEKGGASRDGAILLNDAVLPALAKMAEAFQGGNNPYRDVVEAVQLALSPRMVPKGPAAGGGVPIEVGEDG